MSLLKDFVNDTLRPEDFDHRAHVVVGFEILQSHSLSEALEIYSKHLRALTIRAGAPEKFNMPITTRAMMLIHARQRPDEDVQRFLDRNPDLLQPQAFKQA